MPAIILPNDKTLEVRVSTKCATTTVESIICYPYTKKHMARKASNIVRNLNKFSKSISTTDWEPDFKIAVVRDPVKRLVSAYADRIEIKNKENLQSTIKSWENFLDNLQFLQENSHDISKHTIPQVARLGTSVDYFDRIFSTRQLSNDFLDYMKDISGETIPPTVAHATKKNLTSQIQITKKQIDFIKEFYAVDYKFYSAYFDQ